MKQNSTLNCLGSLKASLVVTSLVIPQLLFQSPAKADQWNKNPLEVACKSYETNKFDKKEQIVGGGWTAGWADDIAEKDVGLGLVTAGVSVLDGGTSFSVWVTHLVERTVSSLGQSLSGNAKNEAIRIARQAISDAVRGKSGKEITKQFDTFDFKAGAIEYSGTNREPIFCNTISKTWGLKPYVAFRIRSSSNPSTANSEVKSSWQRIAGSANDVAVDWVIGTNPEQGGYGIYRWNGSDWDKIPGSAVRIGGNSKNPWVVNKFNEIFRWTGSDWQKMPGSAHDVADGWVIGTNPEQGGYGIYRWNGSDWDKIPGSAVRIGGNSKNPWVVNKFNEIFRWTGSDWQKMPGSAHDVGSGWVIGTNPEQGGYGIYRWNGSDWDKISGSAIHIGDSGDKPWVVNKQKHIFRQ